MGEFEVRWNDALKANEVRLAALAPCDDNWARDLQLLVQCSLRQRPSVPLSDLGQLLRAAGVNVPGRLMAKVEELCQDFAEVDPATQHVRLKSM